MYNINVNKINQFVYPEEQSNLIKGIHCATFDILLLKQRNDYALRRLMHHNTKNVPHVDISLHIENADEQIVSDLEYLTLVNIVFVATSTRVFLVDFSTGKVIKINYPVPHDEVVAAAWNCEQDSLAVAYNSERVMVYCINYSTNELKLLAEDRPDHKGDENVYLGWGDVKKQFKGKGGAAYLNEFHPPVSSYRNSRHDGSISWQFGEKYFSVNSLHGEEHIVRIFDNECRLYYTITNLMIPGICSNTVFRAKHNTLATICQGDDGNSYVVLHERNGGYHNKIFTCHFQSAQIQVDYITFSTCGRFLAIQSHNNDNAAYFLDLYFQSNFQWIHKHRFSGSLNNRFVSYKFSSGSIISQDVVSLELVFKQRIVVYELLKTITNTDNIVYVQNSNTIEQYNYVKAITPPCGVTDKVIRLDGDGETVNNVILSHDQEPPIMVVIDSNEVAHVYHRLMIEDENWECRSKFNLKPLNNQLPVHFYKYLLATIDGVHNLIAIGINPETNEDIKRLIRIDTCETVSEEVIDQVAYLHKTINDNEINLILRSDFQKTIKFALKFVLPTKKIRSILACDGQLSIDNRVVADGVTSMLNYKDLYLLLTIITPDDPMDRVLCVDIQNLLFSNATCGIDGISWSRRVEKGATLVCLANDDGGVILEMTRGNIELVAVRPIILRNIYQKIEAGAFREAYQIVRRHSMKPDILYDLAPHLFHHNVIEFIRSLGSTESVIKFLLPLRDLSTLTSKDFLFVQEFKVSNKMNKICDAIIQSYKDSCNNKENQNNVSYYRIICIALVIKHNHDTYEALKFLVNHFAGRYNAETLLQLADAVSLLKQYGDVNEMYRQALTLYDIELVSTIAQVSGMDPQVYRRFLDVCRHAEPAHRRYLMANEGGNYNYAGLYMLVLYRNESKTLKEFMEYILEKDVMENVCKAMNKGDGEAFDLVTKFLADKFLAKGMHKESAYYFCKAGMTLHAIELLTKGVCWMEAIELIKHTKELRAEDKITLFGKVADACSAREKYREAAVIYVDKCGNIGKGLDCYLTGYLFKEAVDLLDKTEESFDKRPYENRLKELLCENMKNVETNYDRIAKNFKVHYQRLKVVREDRRQRAENNLDGDDAYSEAGSVTTRSHTSASTTTRRTRKLEMKLRSLRHGGKYEDIALMRELYDIMIHLFDMANDLNKLLNIYVHYAKITPIDICIKIGNLQKEMKAAALEIWPVDYANLDDNVLTTDFLTENIVLLDKEHRSMPVLMNGFT